MSDATAAPGTQDQAAARHSRAPIALAIVLALIVLWGGYIEHWKWTGINRHTATLWDWLHLLLLPVVVAILPIWMSRKTRLTKGKKQWSMIALGVFGLIVLFGYVIPWAWTGFVGNTLWDWLGLIALPLALALAPVYDELRRTWSRRHTVIAGCGLGVFLVVVLGGYLAKWSWTGFHGNTVWDWLHLLLLPLLIPIIVVPALKPIAMSGVTVLGEGREAGDRTAAEGEEPRRPAPTGVGAES
ncbi:MAG TPA: hypothetical protein VMU39_01855 [Solirubrobacteraceae bacterium]|nr:hypothetical protein [Solirubrobacteraceae bacterium]